MNKKKKSATRSIIEFVVGSITVIVLVIAFVPQTRMSQARQWSEFCLDVAEAPRQYYSFKKWIGPQYQEVEVYYAKNDIWGGQVIEEKNLSAHMKKVFSEAIIGELYPAKEDIVGTKASEFIFAGAQFSKLNLVRTKFSPRERKGHYSEEDKDHIR